jgi:hypothetical protein
MKLPVELSKENEERPGQDLPSRAIVDFFEQ